MQKKINELLNKNKILENKNKILEKKANKLYKLL
jgi:hypothetical protein